MDQTGVVTAVRGGFCEVEFARSSACESCGGCSLGRKSVVRVTLKNTVGASAGDCVSVDLHGSKVLKASALVYLFPLAALFVGLFAAQAVYREGYYLPQDIFTALCGMGLCALAFLAIRLGEKRRLAKGGYAPQIIAVTGKAADKDFDNV